MTVPSDLHEQIVKSRMEEDPRLKNRGFVKELKVAMQKDLAAQAHKRRGRKIRFTMSWYDASFKRHFGKVALDPDLSRISIKSKLVVCEEVEIYHKLNANRKKAYARLWMQLTQLGWKLKLYTLDELKKKQLIDLGKHYVMSELGYKPLGHSTDDISELIKALAR